MKIATTTGDLSAYLADRSIGAPVPFLRDIGFRYLDLSFYNVIYPGSPWISQGDLWKKEVEDCMKKAEECGVVFCQSHAPDGEHFQEGEARDRFFLAVERTIEACGMLKIPHTVIHGGVTNDLQKKRVFYLRFAEKSEQCSVDMLIENSSEKWIPAGSCFCSGEEMMAFLEASGIPRLHAVWDTGHANCEGRDQYHDILALGSELRALHIADNYGMQDSHVMPLVGTVNFDNVMRGIREISYQGAFTFEAGNTLRHQSDWPHYRNDVKPEDRLADPPLSIQLRQLSVMRAVGEWMVTEYGYTAE